MKTSALTTTLHHHPRLKFCRNETVSWLLHASCNVCRSHEDGSVRFWDVSGSCMRLLYKLDTAPLFGIDTLPHSSSSTADLTDDWPPFRKVTLALSLVFYIVMLYSSLQLLLICWAIRHFEDFFVEKLKYLALLAVNMNAQPSLGYYTFLICSGYIMDILMCFDWLIDLLIDWFIYLFIYWLINLFLMPKVLNSRGLKY